MFEAPESIIQSYVGSDVLFKEIEKHEPDMWEIAWSSEELWDEPEVIKWLESIVVSCWYRLLSRVLRNYPVWPDSWSVLYSGWSWTEFWLTVVVALVGSFENCG